MKRRVLFLPLAALLALIALALPASAGSTWLSTSASTAPASVPWSKTVVVTGFNGDDVRVTVNWRTASNNGGSLRVVDARVTPLVAATGSVDRARGYADATLRIYTRDGDLVRSLGEVGIGGVNGTLFALGDLITNNRGATVRVLLDVRGVEKDVVMPLTHA